MIERSSTGLMPVFSVAGLPLLIPHFVHQNWHIVH
jgi:hypothetical protein